MNGISNNKLWRNIFRCYQIIQMIRELMEKSGHPAPAKNNCQNWFLFQQVFHSKKDMVKDHRYPSSHNSLYEWGSQSPQKTVEGEILHRFHVAPGHAQYVLMIRSKIHQIHPTVVACRTNCIPFFAKQGTLLGICSEPSALCSSEARHKCKPMSFLTVLVRL